MPIEIKELHIRVTVDGKPPANPPKARIGEAKGEAEGEHGGNKDEIVAECVEQVLEILQTKKER